MIKAVILDLGGVVVPLDFQLGYATFSNLTPYSSGEIERRILATGLIDELETGRVEPEEFARLMSAALDLDIPFSQFSELWGSIFLPDTLISEELLVKIGRRNKLLLLSNTNAIHFDFIQRNYPLMERFDDFVLSHEVGVMKPGAEIYRVAIERAGCLPEECFFTDDRQENVTGALREGIESCRFTTQERLVAELVSRGVAF